MIDVNIRYQVNGTETDIAIELPTSRQSLADVLKNSGFASPEKIKVKRTGQPYLVRLYTDTLMGDAIIDRLCENDTLADLNSLCQVISQCSDQENVMRTILDSDVRCINGIKRLFADRFIEFSDKLVLNTRLERKPMELAGQACVIEKAIPVSHKKLQSIVNAPLNDEPIIAENRENMFFDSRDNMYHCLLIYDRDYGDGIVVNSEGSSYARYAQYIPQAKVIYEQYRSSHLNELKLYWPLSIVSFKNGESEDITAYRAAFYCKDIRKALRELDLPAERERGLMHWYHDGGSIDEKVYSAHMDVEVSGGELVGVIRAKVLGELTDDEMSAFIDYCTGQLSDGAGESFKQKYVRTDDGEIKVSFWSDDEAWELVSEEEYMNDNTQYLGMSM